jgi:hypothetical protein
MSRITPPVSKLARSINSASTRQFDVRHNAGAILMPKYAELLRNRKSAEPADVSPSYYDIGDCCVRYFVHLRKGLGGHNELIVLQNRPTAVVSKQHIDLLRNHPLPVDPSP